MNSKQRTILVTSALPYANGPIHLGHLVEYIQTDIWARFQKMRGHQCHYICADDTHGTPVMLRAEQEGTTPEALIARMHTEHLRDFTKFYIAFDHYGSTNSDTNRELSCDIYRKLKDAGLISVRSIEQYYDPQRKMFLPDRYIKGECPKCHARDQYGDGCEVCGSIYATTDLINPVSVVSGATPVRNKSEHYFFKLSECQSFLQQWMRGDCNRDRASPLQTETANKLREWFDAGLKDWDISRDAPYFGFEIPDAPGKFFYVWLDAPIGYMASFHAFADQNGLDFDSYWDDGSTTELYHFIGKDILNHHALFWPATLHASGHRTPNRICVHGFLTVNGQKMSKSRGTFITAHTYLEYLDPEYLRYYLAAKLNDRVEDIDLNFEDFIARVNSNLVGKYVNIASRSGGFITKHFDGALGPALDDAGHKLVKQFQQQAQHIAGLYEKRQYSEAIRVIMELADLANEYINDTRPWEVAKDAGRQDLLHRLCTTNINLFRLLTLYLKPVLPRIAAQVEDFLEISPLGWDDAWVLLTDHRIQPYRHLAQRIDAKQVAAMVDASRL